MPREEIDFTMTLTDVLDRLGVTRQIDTENPQKRKWSIPGRFLGSFDAHEGWCVLRHYNRCGHWGIAIREAQGELHHGWDYEP